MKVLVSFLLLAFQASRHRCGSDSASGIRFTTTSVWPTVIRKVTCSAEQVEGTDTLFCIQMNMTRSGSTQMVAKMCKSDPTNVSKEPLEQKSLGLVAQRGVINTTNSAASYLELFFLDCPCANPKPPGPGDEAETAANDQTFTCCYYTSLGSHSSTGSRKSVSADVSVINVTELTCCVAEGCSADDKGFGCNDRGTQDSSEGVCISDELIGVAIQRGDEHGGTPNYTTLTPHSVGASPARYQFHRTVDGLVIYAGSVTKKGVRLHGYFPIPHGQQQLLYRCSVWSEPETGRCHKTLTYVPGQLGVCKIDDSVGQTGAQKGEQKARSQTVTVVLCVFIVILVVTLITVACLCYWGKCPQRRHGQPTRPAASEGLLWSEAERRENKENDRRDSDRDSANSERLDTIETHV